MVFTCSKKSIAHDSSSVKAVCKIVNLVYEINVGNFMSLDTKKCFSMPLSVFYKASHKAGKCFVPTVVGFLAPKLPSCLMTLLCGLKLG